MFTVYRKARQLRDPHTLPHAWLFQIAKNAAAASIMQSRHVRSITVQLDDSPERMPTARTEVTPRIPNSPHGMSFLDSEERDVMTLRFVEQWEYHEIAAAKSIPIGSVKWRVFNAKKKASRQHSGQFERRDAKSRVNSGPRRRQRVMGSYVWRRSAQTAGEDLTSHLLMHLSAGELSQVGKVIT